MVDGAESPIRRDVDAVDEGHVVVHGHDAIDAFGVHDVGVERQVVRQLVAGAAGVLVRVYGTLMPLIEISVCWVAGTSDRSGQ